MRCWFSFLFLFLCFGEAYAASILTYKSDQRVMQVFLAENQIATSHGIYDVDRDEIVVFRHKEKAYSKVTGAQLAQLVTTAQKAASSLQQLGGFLPPDYRRELERQASRIPTDSLEFKKSGALKKGGYACQSYTLLSANAAQGDVCVSNVEELGVPKAHLRGLEVITNRFSTIINSQLSGFPALVRGRLPVYWQDNKGDKWHLESVKPVSKPRAIPKGWDQVPFDLSLLYPS